VRCRLGGDDAIHDRRQRGEAEPLVHRPMGGRGLARERTAVARGVPPSPAVDAPDGISTSSTPMFLAEASEAATPETP
jgi:hypothetical protein